MRETIERALPIVAAALGNKLGVEVVVAGQQALTDGKTIVIPNCEERINPDAIYGYLAHEAAHVRYTDFAERSPLDKPILHRLENILEDIRIEREMHKMYPGTKSMISKTIAAMAEEGKFAPQNGPAGSVVCGHALLKLRNEVIGQDFLDKAAEQQEKILRETFGAEVVARLNGLLSLAGKTASTKEACDLARRIVAMLEEEAEKEKERQKKQNGQAPRPQNGGGDPGDLSCGNGEGEGGNGEAGEGMPGDGKDGSSAGESGTKNGKEKADGGPDAGEGGSVIKAIDEALGASEGDLPKDVFETIREDIEKNQVRSPSADQILAEQYEPSKMDRRFLNEVEAASVPLAAALEGIVQSVRTDRPYDQRRGRRINERKLCRVKLGDPRVFVKHTERYSPDTAIYLLLDLSSSMNESQEIAKQSAMALALALRRIRGVETALAVFPSMTHRATHAIDSVMRFGDDPQLRSGALARLKANGGTPMNEALFFVASRILRRKERRRTVMVITDGAPHHAPATKNTINRMVASGLEVYGLGIGTMSVVDLFPQYAIIQGIDELKPAMFDMARQILIGRAA